MPDEQPVFGDRYRIVRHIARGGMAQVYLARDLLLDRPVALKVLFPELSVDEAFVERFRREAQAAANLSHPNIVSIYDWGQGDRTYFIVMEYVDGETLSARIRRAPLPADQAAGIAIATASALSFAHQRNVIHRDVKPGNVLIDRSGQVKVADFGIARAVGTSENLTQAGAVMGTATYFSPEQAQGFAVDARSDVYSLGVVLYEMVVGRPPFQGENPVAIAYKHVREAPVPPRSRNPAIPAAYETIVLRALAKDPAARYQTADELRADLERFRSGRRVLGGVDPAATTVLGAGDATTAVAGATTVMGAAAVDRTTVAAAPDPTTVGRRRLPPPAVPPGGGSVDDTGPFGEDRPSRTRLWVGLAVALVIVLAVLGYFIGRDLGHFGGSRTLTVPDVAGQPAATAESRLHAVGFSKVTEKTVTSSSVAKGSATGTDPAAQSREKSDTRIILDVSAGPATLALPDVAGQPQSQAVAALKAKGFETNVSQDTSTTVASGDVIKTLPAGGAQVAPGIAVQVVVSSGKPLVPIPGVASDTVAQAAVTLSNLGFHPAQGQQSSSSVPSGSIIGTSPPQGQSAPYGSTVTIEVSSGPAMVSVPAITGDTMARASARLSAAGLTPSFQTTQVDTQAQNGKVQSTNPPAGADVKKGSTVDVILGSYTPPTTTSTSSTSTTTTSLPGPTTTSSLPGPGPGPGAAAGPPGRRTTTPAAGGG